jgi:HEAT repeat protein
VAAFQRLAARTTEDLLRTYVARQTLWSAGEAAIAQALLSGDGDLRLEAVRIVGARKLKAQLPTVIRLLSDSDEATRDAALGAVVALGERSAIKALADSRQMRDSYEMSKVVDAVASLGGQEAKDYLSFVAETHDDPDIRKMAEAALARLKAREAKSAPTR